MIGENVLFSRPTLLEYEAIQVFFSFFLAYHMCPTRRAMGEEIRILVSSRTYRRLASTPPTPFNPDSSEVILWIIIKSRLVIRRAGGITSCFSTTHFFDQQLDAAISLLIENKGSQILIPLQ